MGVMYFCDKCDRELQGSNSMVEVRLGMSNDYRDPGGTGVHLCEHCVQRLRDWLKPDPKESPK